MDIEPGVSFGVYEIESLIGMGSMGEVWKALDTKLGRGVAIKFLPDEFAADQTRLARFEREAKILASLNYPNIGAIYGFEELEGMHFLILELVDGRTLAEMIKSGPIPLDNSLEIAIQITAAVESAHANGVTHRDLKPANLMVNSEERVKVLDFGLAKGIVGPDGDGVGSTTLTLIGTQSGVLMGTGPYMSPGQVKGNEAERTSDMWA